ncbi:Histidine protein methyltransferase 1 [Phytophthora cinnamomi]|uniref:Histidine protein methyltransferase 1 n=1 Tax=Phytophthora cinnamomi TaxID=4785 RepID=UPI00355AB406|nr:Histidine protein methyltransferase 1 [Phytophthora cinnamomi]
MSFSFNFALDGAAPAPAAPSAAAPAASAPGRSGERFSPSAACSSLPAAAFSSVQAGALRFDIVNTTGADFLARTGAIRAVLSTSDVQTGVYEGGFKLWECSLDLVRFVEAQVPHMPPAVLELGCGHGLPGIHALQRGARRVVFSDYNKEVLELTTSPNVRRNAGAQLYDRAEFYAGAWSSMSQYMRDVERRSDEQMQFDLILTAETIYTEAVAEELYQTIKRHLRRAPHARALVAAKKYYFGTNGSVQHFVGLVQADGVLRAETVWEERDCRSNIREIVQLSYAA